MDKIRVSKLIQNNIHFIGLVVLVVIAFLSTTYYSSYKKTQVAALKKLGQSVSWIENLQQYGIKTKLALTAAGISAKQGMTLGEAMNRLGVIGDAAEVKDENVESFLSRMGKEKEGTEREDVESFLSRMRGN